MAYLSNSGHTEDMANLVVESIKEAGAEVEAIEASEADAAEMLEADVIVLGCPACGTEELDEDYIEPLMEAFEGKLEDKKVALFGSYGWGGGEYMDTWVSRMEDLGADVLGFVTAEEGPDGAEDELKELGEKIAKA